jgi:hypothetical protein
MPSYPQASSSPNGVSRGNLFVEPDPDDPPPPTPVPASAAGAGPRLSAPRRRGRGLVVPVVDAPTRRGMTAGVSDAARFTRTRTGMGALSGTARQHALGADRNARRLLGQLAAHPYGALIALIAVAVLLLAISWLGLSLRAAAGERDHAQRQQRAAAVALEDARGRIHTLATQRDRSAAAARTAGRQQVGAAAALATWRTRAGTAQRQLARARHNSRRRHRR